MGRPVKWTEQKIEEFVAKGYGQGFGATYKPWIAVRDGSSLGRCHNPKCLKTGRQLELLSDIELHLFLALDWQADVSAIREQYPLDRDISQTVADELGIEHPCYPGTNVKAVMTVDFLVTRLRNGADQLEAYNAKATSEAEDKRSLEKLEIQRAYFAKLDIPHHLVFDSDIPIQNIRNIAWIRDALAKDGEKEPHPGYFDSMAARMEVTLAQAVGTSTPLTTFCKVFDTNNAAKPGTGLRAARMLMANRVLVVDLSRPNIEVTPMSQLRLMGSHANLRVMGGHQ